MTKCLICGFGNSVGYYCEFCRKDINNLTDLIEKIKDTTLRENINDKFNVILVSLYRKDK
jgi:hypothetical protein